MAIKENDFVELTYTGTLKDGQVFDTTDVHVAKEHGLVREGATFEPIVVCVGHAHLLPAFDKDLIGKELNKEYRLQLAATDAFGKREPSKLFKQEWFIKQKVNPVPGLEVTVGNDRGVIRSVSGGRVYVDLNHPLAGHEISYTYKILRLITETQKQIAALVKLRLGFDAGVSITEKNAEIAVPIDLPKELQEYIKKEVLEITGCMVSFKKIDLATDKPKQE